MEKIKIDKNDLKIHNFVIVYTSPIDYEMQRYCLLEDIKGLDYDEYVIVEGGHCSCYDFDETEWEYFKYDKEELKKLCDIKSIDEYIDRDERTFYILCKNYLNSRW